MSDRSTIQILPHLPIILGAADTTSANNGEPQATPITFEDHGAPPAPVVHATHPSPTSPQAKPRNLVKADLGEVEKAWRRYQGTHDRDVVYGYLSAVYKVVMKWKREQRAWKSAALALRLQCDTTSMRVEPLAVVIRCTSAPAKVDGKTRSKWSRALRVAEAFKGPDSSIQAFIKGQDGINTCVARVREMANRK